MSRTWIGVLALVSAPASLADERLDQQPAASVLTQGYRFIAKSEMTVESNQGFDLVDGKFAPKHQESVTNELSEYFGSAVFRRVYDVAGIPETPSIGSCTFDRIFRPKKLVFAPPVGKIRTEKASKTKNGDEIVHTWGFELASPARTSVHASMGEEMPECVDLDLSQEYMKKTQLIGTRCCGPEGSGTLSFGDLKRIVGETFEIVAPLRHERTGCRGLKR